MKDLNPIPPSVALKVTWNAIKVIAAFVFGFWLMMRIADNGQEIDKQMDNGINTMLYGNNN